MKREQPFEPTAGWLPLVILIAISLAAISGFIIGVTMQQPILIVGSMISLVAVGIGAIGFVAIPPNQSRVLLLFGEYQGTVRSTGFFWVNPFYSKQKLSLRIRNFETGSTSTPEEKDQSGRVVKQSGRTQSKPSKVNDCDGNPVEISAVVVWKVIDTAEALFEVDNYEHYVEVQSEAALRDLAMRHPYDSNDDTISLRGNPDEVCATLQSDIQLRLENAGVEIIEARISHLAYAPEIAAAMLQRQQAQAVVAARTQIVEGAVGMVEMALDQLSERAMVELDEERKANMVSNLLIVLCSDRATQPVVNAGSLY
ncbi:SPFH domain-containing protein [bacterium]|nr:SPFH domain-containing protein [bacterium]MDC0278873.1 SPFH domain-containing protein [bacterium]